MKYKVTWEERGRWSESRECFASRGEADQWAVERLPLGVIRFRTGSYEIVRTRRAAAVRPFLRNTTDTSLRKDSGMNVSTFSLFTSHSSFLP